MLRIPFFIPRLRRLWNGASVQAYVDGYPSQRDPSRSRVLRTLVVGSAQALALRASCSLRGHPWTEDNSSIGPDSGTEDRGCRCGKEHFHHVYY